MAIASCVDHILLVRQGHVVKRCHTERVIGEYTNGHHSAGVAALLIAFTDGEASARLLMVAIHHDVPEGLCGDTPAPAKWWQSPEAKESLVVAEREICRNGDLQYVDTLTESESDLLYLADKMELMFYCLEQRRMGNSCVDHIFRKLAGRLEQLGLVEMAPPPAQELYMYLMDNYPGDWQNAEGIMDMHPNAPKKR